MFLGVKDISIDCCHLSRLTLNIIRRVQGTEQNEDDQLSTIEIGYTSKGFELLTFYMGNLHSIDSVTPIS